MAESFQEFIAAEWELERQAWVREVAARLPEEELADVDVFQLRDDLAACEADDQPATAALEGAILDQAVAFKAARLRPPPAGGRAKR